MIRFDLNYRLEFFENGIQKIVINEKAKDRNILTTKFAIQKSPFQGVNTATFTIYNLKQETRKALFKDRLNTEFNKELRFYVGYGSDLFLCFKGTIDECYSKSLPPDNITNIVCVDGLRTTTNAFANITLKEGQNLKDVFYQITNFLGVPKGTVKSIEEGVINKDFTINGKALEEVNKLYNNSVYIENETYNKISDKETLDEATIIIDSGIILETPRRENNYISLSTLFLPELKINSKVLLDSNFNVAFNGDYKVITINHDGQISGCVESKVITKLNLMKL